MATAVMDHYDVRRYVWVVYYVQQKAVKLGFFFKNVKFTIKLMFCITFFMPSKGILWLYNILLETSYFLREILSCEFSDFWLDVFKIQTHTFIVNQM